ncbi:MAG: PAS domain-containing protein [Fusobacterium sp. JB021]|nr:PAS domain-containing protein [Fusobacterium sp. JB021]MDP0507672.1 PAS domain-containing protein [Fusobacterium sp. JB019]
MKAELYPYLGLIDFLAHTLGPDYEIVLYDFSFEGSSIISIANGGISGRKVGAPLNKKSMEAISKGVYKSKNYISDYISLSKEGKMLRSNIYFIKSSNNELLGLLCINFDDSRYQLLVEDVLRLCHPNDFAREKNIYIDKPELKEINKNEFENFYSSMEDAVDEILKVSIDGLGMPVERLTLDEKMRIVETMSNQGVFILRGAVKYVAEKLKCSQASIYRYLKKVKDNTK